MKDAVLKAYCEGGRVVDIARDFGTTPTTIYRWARAAGVFEYRHAGPKSAAPRATILEMRKKGASFAEIGAVVGLTRQRVQQLASTPEPRGTVRPDDSAVRCKPDALAALDRWRAERGLSRPEALRLIIEEKCGR